MKITLLVVVLAMEPVFVYVGFFAHRVFVRFSAQTAAFMLPLIAVALGYAIWQEATAVRRLAEHIDPRTREQWGNFVQTYSMVGLIGSAIRLSVRWDQAF